MRNFDVFDIFVKQSETAGRKSFVAGAVLVGFGLLILLFPQVLIALVASFFIIVGALFFYLAWSAHEFRKRHGDTVRVHIDETW